MKTAPAHSTPARLARQVEALVLSTPALDIHTHLYDPAFSQLLLWGLDDLLVYHYLVAETFR
ncbi:MAG TPA: glucuronate isomerase, partial [Verrucomicrobiae bacterium]